MEVAWEEWSKSLLKYLGVAVPGESSAGGAAMQKLPENPSAEEIRAASKEALQDFSERSPANYQIVYQEFVRRANNPKEEENRGLAPMETDDMDAEFELREAERVHTLNLKCLNAILAYEWTTKRKCCCFNRQPFSSYNGGGLETKTVNLETFGTILNYFGPLKDNMAPETFLDRLRGIVCKSWFHGDLQTRV